MKIILLSVFLLFGWLNLVAETFPIADKVLVYKSERKMVLLKDEKPYLEYTVSLGDVPEGHKEQMGDEKTPEGLYTIDYRNPKSAYHLSLHINYPSKEDKAHAKELGVNPGGDIFIHGSPNGYTFSEAVLKVMDWTDGCIALSDEEIEQVWKLVKNGTPIEILP